MDSISHKEYYLQQKYKNIVQLFLFLDIVLCASYPLELVSLTSSMVFTLLARIVETSIHSWTFIQILVIDLHLIHPNENESLTLWILGISIHHSIIQYQTRKSHWMKKREIKSSFRHDIS